MTAIIGFSGRKQSGKSTSCNFLMGSAMKYLDIIKGGFKITNTGQLFITDINGDNSYQGIFDYNRRTKAMKKFLAQKTNNYIKFYAFADTLKYDIGMNLFGLSYESVNGTDEQKNTATHLRWEDVFGVISDKNTYEDFLKLDTENQRKNIEYHKSGYMTGREFLEFFGTTVCRSVKDDCWINAVLSKIKDDSPEIAVISDIRFPNEIIRLREFNEDTTIVRLKRNPFNTQNKIECALDDFSEFDHILDNSEMSIHELCQALYSILNIESSIE